jgi:hypothetical protein
MSLTLTPLQTDSFNRANVNPLTAPWALDIANDFGFQISSDICVCHGQHLLTLTNGKNNPSI